MAAAGQHLPKDARGPSAVVLADRAEVTGGSWRGAASSGTTPLASYWWLNRRRPAVWWTTPGFMRTLVCVTAPGAADLRATITDGLLAGVPH
jgi:hypothetical protein